MRWLLSAMNRMGEVGRSYVYSGDLDGASWYQLLLLIFREDGNVSPLADAALETKSFSPLVLIMIT